MKPVTKEAEKALKDALPYPMRGNSVSQVVQVKTGRDPGVTVGVKYGTKRSSNARMANTKGQIRHPVFADGDKARKEWRWVNQSVPNAKGWFDETYRDSAPTIRRSLEAAMESIADEVVRRAK